MIRLVRVFNVIGRISGAGYRSGKALLHFSHVFFIILFLFFRGVCARRNIPVAVGRELWGGGEGEGRPQCPGED